MGTHLSAPLSNVNRAALRQPIRAALCNDGMRTVEEVRRVRLAQLKAEFGGWVALNTKLEMAAPTRDSTLSQIANASTGTKTRKPKTMGSEMARRLETACGKPPGWMDTDPDFESFRWPFGERVDINQVHDLAEPLLSEAVGALNHILSRAAAAPDPDPAPPAEAAPAPANQQNVGVTDKYGAPLRYFKPPQLPPAKSGSSPSPAPAPTGKARSQS